MIARVRAGLTSTLYRHTIALRACDVSGSAAITLMGTDVERIVDALAQFHELWASVLEVGIATWLLAREISLAAFVPLVVCVGESPFVDRELCGGPPLHLLTLFYRVRDRCITGCCAFWTSSKGME